MAALFCGAYPAHLFSLLCRSAPKETLGLSKKWAALRAGDPTQAHSFFYFANAKALTP